MIGIIERVVSKNPLNADFIFHINHAMSFPLNFRKKIWRVYSLIKYPT
jgi:hypothetical protein